MVACVQLSVPLKTSALETGYNCKSQLICSFASLFFLASSHFSNWWPWWLEKLQKRGAYAWFGQQLGSSHCGCFSRLSVAAYFERVSLLVGVEKICIARFGLITWTVKALVVQKGWTAISIIFLLKWDRSNMSTNQTEIAPNPVDIADFRGLSSLYDLAPEMGSTLGSDPCNDYCSFDRWSRRCFSTNS